MEKEKLNSLAAQAAQGDSAAWEALYRAIEELTRSVCRRNSMSKEDTEDIVQEVALSLSGRLDELAGMENPEGYIRRAANNKCVDIVRADSKLPTERFREHEEVLLQKPDTDPTPENVIAGLNPDKLIDDFLSELPEDQRVCLTMRYMDGYTNKQISQRLGVPVGTVASRVRYAKSALQKRVTEYEKKYGVKLHAKWLLPFMPFRLFQGSVDILMTDGGSTVSEITRAVTGAVAVVVMGGAIIGSGLVFRNNEPPLPTQPAAVQTASEPRDEQPRTAATVYRDVYETQTQTVYETVTREVNAAAGATEPSENQNRSAVRETQPLTMPDSLHEGSNRYVADDDVLQQTNYHSTGMNADVIFPERWIGNTVVKERTGYDTQPILEVFDRADDIEYMNGITESESGMSYNSLIKILRKEGNADAEEDLSIAGEYTFPMGVCRDKNGNITARYYMRLAWSKGSITKTELDYDTINKDILSVAESFRPDEASYQFVLTDSDKNMILTYNH